MKALIPLAEALADILKEHKQTVAVAESSAGGLISAALLAVPGASAYFLGGAVVYTRQARDALLGITQEQMANMRPSTEDYALLLARTARRKFAANWAVAETGATGPTGNRYGDAAGHACIAVVGPDDSEAVSTIETGHGDRQANMREFAAAALRLLKQNLEM
ncbi:MAG TPA: CinA family protein [Alphaproteobacteria bacterium]